MSGRPARTSTSSRCLACRYATPMVWTSASTLGYGDAVTPGPEEATYPTLLDGSPAPHVRVYPRATVVAETDCAQPDNQARTPLLRVSPKKVRVRTGSDEGNRFIIWVTVDQEPVVARVTLSAVGFTASPAWKSACQWVVQKSGLEGSALHEVVHRFREFRDVTLSVRHCPLQV